jgi:hypothetical protein
LPSSDDVSIDSDFYSDEEDIRGRRSNRLRKQKEKSKSKSRDQRGHKLGRSLRSRGNNVNYNVDDAGSADQSQS